MKVLVTRLAVLAALLTTSDAALATPVRVFVSAAQLDQICSSPAGKIECAEYIIGVSDEFDDAVAVSVKPPTSACPPE